MSSRHDKRLNTIPSNGKPGFKAENRLAFLPENKNRPFQRSKNRPICGDKKAKFTPRKIPENGRLSVRRVLVFYKSAAELTGRLTPPRHPRRSAPSGAETSTLLSLTHRPANRLTESLPPTKRDAGAREPPLNRFASPRASARFPVFRFGYPWF